MGNRSGQKSDRQGDNAGSVNSDQWRDQILCGDAYEQLRQLPDDLVDTIVTSPPYYRQRDYQSPQQIGQEASLAHFLKGIEVVVGHD